jgi:hypothetical protein
MIIHSFLLVLSLTSVVVNSLLDNKADFNGDKDTKKNKITNGKALLATALVNTITQIMMAYILD